MIRPPGLLGAAFGTAVDGDGRNDPDVRSRLAVEFGVPADWASVDQVHGAAVVQATEAGNLGEADATFTSRSGLALAVATADCVPVVIEGPDVAGVAHAGWRGVTAGVIPALLDAMRSAGLSPVRAGIGPSIGPCCYEVGEDVLSGLGRFAAVTTWGTTSLDLWSAAASTLNGLAVWRSDECTLCGTGHYSHRRDGTTERQVTLAWLPDD
jgi:YfiH family protein